MRTRAQKYNEGLMVGGISNIFVMVVFVLGIWKLFELLLNLL